MSLSGTLRVVGIFLTDAVGRKCPVFMLLVLLMLAQHSASAMSFYAIGNSLTNDTYPDAIPALAQDAGLALTTGYHIRGSASMTYMAGFPADVTLAKPSRHDVALMAQGYDAIAFQPSFGFDSATYAGERTAMITVIERVLQAYPGRTVFYIYAPWPGTGDTGGNFDAYWRQTTGIDLNGTWKYTRSHFDGLLADLRAHFGSRASVRVIPVGDVMARIDRDARAGLIPGISDMSMLYRDTLHMGEVGRFVAASTVLATLFQQQPASNAAQAIYQFNDGAAMLTPQLATQLESLIWSVVLADERTRAASSSSASSSSSVSSSSASSSASSGVSSSSATSSSAGATSSSSGSVAAPLTSSGSGAMDGMMLLALLAAICRPQAVKRARHDRALPHRSTQLGGWSRWPRIHS